MNISELCIRRPVMTVLLSAALVVAGVLAYLRIPIAALPSYNTPVIAVSAQLPGAASADTARYVHLVAEAMRRAFLDRARWLGDPDFGALPVERLTSKAYAAELRATIDREDRPDDLDA